MLQLVPGFQARAGTAQCRAGWKLRVLTGPDEPLPGELWGWAALPPPEETGVPGSSSLGGLRLCPPEAPQVEGE